MAGASAAPEPAHAARPARGQDQPHRPRLPQHEGVSRLRPGPQRQAVTTEAQIVIAAEIAPHGLDFAQLDPMTTAAERELEAAGVTESPEVVSADAGYWANDHIDRLRQRGMTPIVAPDAHTRDGPRKTRLGGPYDFMRRVLATDKGSELYSRRQGMMEPVFADIKQNRRAGRFKRRGRAAVRSE